MKSLLTAAAVASLALAPAYAGCLYPHAPGNMPDGNVATMKQMLAAQKTVRAYKHKMTVYLACIKKQSNAAIIKKSTTLSKKQMSAFESMELKRHNAAVDQLKTVAREFNAQVRAYEKKHSKKST